MLESMLVGCDLMGYIDGSVPCPPQYKVAHEAGFNPEPELTQEYKDWRKHDYAIMTLLAGTLSSDALSFIISSKTSKEVWFSLEERYAKFSKFKVFELNTSMCNIQKGSDNIEKYLQHIKTVRDQLSVAGVSIPDEEMVILILNGLPSEFATMKTIIRIKTLNSPVSMEELRSLLLIAEDEINQSVKSISLSLEAAIAAFDDNSRGTLPSHSLNNSLPNSEMVCSSTTPAAIISNTNALTRNSSKSVTQYGCVPLSTIISTTPGVASPSGCIMQYMPNYEYMMSVAPAALNGYINGPPNDNLCTPSDLNCSLVSDKSLRTKMGSGDSGSICAACQICYNFGHFANSCSKRFAPRQVVASGSSMQCQICFKKGHSAAECLRRHYSSIQQQSYAAPKALHAFISTQTLLVPPASLLPVPMKACQPMELWPSLPLIPPG